MSINADIYNWDAWIELAPDFDWDKLPSDSQPDPDPDPDPDPEPEAGTYTAEYGETY